MSLRPNTNGMKRRKKPDFFHCELSSVTLRSLCALFYT